jgi:hypothetical protein
LRMRPFLTNGKPLDLQANRVLFHRIVFSSSISFMHEGDFFP